MVYVVAKSSFDFASVMKNLPRGQYDVSSSVINATDGATVPPESARGESGAFIFIVSFDAGVAPIVMPPDAPTASVTDTSMMLSPVSVVVPLNRARTRICLPLASAAS